MYLPSLQAPRRDTPTEDAINDVLSDLAVEVARGHRHREVALANLKTANVAIDSACKSDERVAKLKVALASLVVAARKLGDKT